MKSLFILFGLFIFSTPLLIAQTNGSISLGPDKILPSCQSCDTLHATTTPAQAGTLNYAVSQITYNPYPFVGSNIIPVTNDDWWSPVINIPFDFCFFGNIYNQCVAGSNGLISFDISNANSPNAWSFGSPGTPLPTTAYPDAMNSIMCPYHDLYPPSGGTMSWDVYGTMPNRVFVVSWNLLPMFFTSCNVLLNTQQIAIYEGTNKIETYIGTKDLCSAWNSGQAVHGIQNSTGTVAFVVPGRNLPMQWTTSNDAWQFLPIGGGSGGGSVNAVVDWFDMNGNPLSTNVDSLVVCPTQTTSYVAKATFTLCGGLEYAFDTITVIKQAPVDISISNIIDVNCFNGNDGSFDISVSGGGSPYNLQLNGTPTSLGTQSGLTAGTYTVVATDIHNCSSSTEVIVNEPTEVQLAIVEQRDVLCKYQNTGYIHVQSTGGVPGYQYWFDQNLPGSSPNFDYLNAGTYVCYTSDTHGCLDSLTVDILQPDSLLTVTQIAHEATCINKKDGSVDAIASGGVSPYMYEWNTSPMQTSATASNLQTGVYHVLVTDANDCITSTQIPVDQQLCCQLFLPNAFTPNGDHVNDMFHVSEYGGGVILGEFRIYNRWGQEVFSTRDINLGWNGNYKGVEQNADTYFYILQYQCNDKGTISQKVAKGELILIR